MKKSFIYRIAQVFIILSAAGIGASLYSYHVDGLLQPVGIAEIARVKKQCEAKWGVTCGMVGGMTPQFSLEEGEAGPEDI